MTITSRLLMLLAWGLALAGTAMTALAQDEKKIPDARLEGFTRAVKVEGSVTLTWILFIVLTVVCMGALFKNANRSHLD